MISFSTAVFILPFDVVVGGVSGISISVYHLLPWEIDVEVIISVITWLLFFIGFAVLGSGFALKTLTSAVIYPLGVALFAPLADPTVLGGFFCLAESGYAQLSPIIAATVGGGLIGVGCSLALLGGGSTGGVDVIALILCRVFKRLRSSVAFFMIDAVIISLGAFVIKDLVLTLLGVLSVLISAIMVDKVFLGGSQGFVAYVITDSSDELSSAVIDEMGRTTTVIDALGGYSRERKKLVMISFTVRQYAALVEIIERIDKNAFVSIHKAHEINGKGFSR